MFELPSYYYSPILPDGTYQGVCVFFGEHRPKNTQQISQGVTLRADFKINRNGQVFDISHFFGVRDPERPWREKLAREDLAEMAWAAGWDDYTPKNTSEFINKSVGLVVEKKDRYLRITKFVRPTTESLEPISSAPTYSQMVSAIEQQEQQQSPGVSDELPPHWAKPSK